jgi:hypothetical protein
MTLLQTSPLQQLTEQIADWRSTELEVDLTTRVVRNIALTGRKSRNGYEYTPEALRGAISLYEHKPVFLDHAVRSNRPFDRSTRDLVGSIVEPRFEQGRIRGNIKVLDTEAGRTFLALTEADEIPVGMSHVVLARRSADRKQVESIEEVVSVDAVIYPATTASFRESYDPQNREPVVNSAEAIRQRIEMSLPEHLQSIDEARTLFVRGVYPGFVLLDEQSSEETESFFALEWTDNDGGLVLGESLNPVSVEELNAIVWSLETDQSRELQVEHDRLRKQLEEVQRSSSRQKILAESGLPDYAVTDEFRQQILKAESDDEGRKLIRDRLAIIQESRQRAPLSRPRRSENQCGPSDQQIVSLIRAGRTVPQGRLVTH